MASTAATDSGTLISPSSGTVRGSPRGSGPESLKEDTSASALQSTDQASTAGTGTGSGSDNKRRRSSASASAGPNEPGRFQRAFQACERCRRKKLRCTGGCPCTRCVRSKALCDFGDTGVDRQRQEPPHDSRTRLSQLEKQVESLLSVLPNGLAPQTLMPNNNLGISDDRSGFGSMHNFTPQTTSLSLISAPPPPMIGSAQFHPFSSVPVQTASTFRFSHSGPSPADSLGALSVTSNNKPKDSPEGRLAVASQSGPGFTAPFQPLTYRPGLWENREASRATSPQPDYPSSRDESWNVFEARAGPKDDPITVGIVDEVMADTLFNFFITKCHFYLPVLQTSTGVLNRQEVQLRCPYLFTTILAIGARFYPKHCIRFPNPPLPIVSSEAPAAIARLAYSHLAASLFRKQHQLGDVQATLLLAGWGLQSGGGGPDPWLVTGHCARLAHRLGLHRVTGTVPNAGGAHESAATEKTWAQWRTWLAWYHFDGFLSLGFGRPQSSGLGNVDDGVLARLTEGNGNGGSPPVSDLYIASLVQLTKIVRDLIDWVQMLSDWHGEVLHGPLTRDGQDYSIIALLRELNKRLDDWTRTWTWNGSLLAIQLGAASRLSKLQSEHVRLCINSLALKPGVQEHATGEEIELLQSSVRRAAEAAMNTVQMHSDAAKGDMSLSYSVDYLTIALGQAAVFLIRLQSNSTPVPVDNAVTLHYLRTAIELLEDTDLSETRNSTYVGKVCRDLCRVAGIAVPPRPGAVGSGAELPTMGLWDFDMLNGTNQDLEGFFGFDGAGLDLSFLFDFQSSGNGAMSSRPTTAMGGDML